MATTRKTPPTPRAKRKAPAKRKGPAAARTKSQITKKAPTKRLVARRLKNTKPGVFPNPHHKFPFEAWDGPKTIGKFKTLADVTLFAEAYAAKHKTPVRIMKE